MQASLSTDRFGNLQDLTNTGEVAVAFNGATSPIHGTFDTLTIFGKKCYTIQFKIVDGSQYEAIIGLDFLDRYSTSMDFQQGILKLDSDENVSIKKHGCDTNHIPIHSCTADTVIPLQSRAYLLCSVIGLTQSPGAGLCLENTTSFTEELSLLVAHSIGPSNGQTFVKVVNVNDQPLSVRNWASFLKLVECKLIPSSNNKL